MAAVIKFSDDQVTSRSHAEADAIVRALEAAGIPATMRVVNETWAGVHVRARDWRRASLAVGVFDAGSEHGRRLVRGLS